MKKTTSKVDDKPRSVSGDDVGVKQRGVSANDVSVKSRNISANDAKEAITFIAQHILNAETGGKVFGIVEKMGQFLSALYHGFSTMDSAQTVEMKSQLNDATLSDGARVLTNTMFSTVQKPLRIEKLNYVNSILAASKTGKRALRMPTLEGIIEASEFIMSNVVFFGDILVEINSLFKAFSTAKEYTQQDNSGSRAVWSPKEEELLSAITHAK